MAASPQLVRSPRPRRSILDLAPLELECMKTLWPLGEATVRQIQQRLAPFRPRAYTTIMTIMDRLAQKGVVVRHKVGRAYLYSPALTAEQARAHAVEQLVEGFFQGSSAALAAHLSGQRGGPPPPSRPPLPGVAPGPGTARVERAAEVVDQSATPAKGFPAAPLDESLL